MESYITKLESYQKKKVKIYIDDVFCFFLYINEVKRLKLQEGECISKQMLEEIYKSILLPRCKNKLCSLLEYKDRTDQELKERLIREGYPKELVEEGISWAKEYRLIDNDRFAANYVKVNEGKKGNYLLRKELSRKGIEKTVVDELLADVEKQEKDNIEKLYQKRFSSIDLQDEKQRMKVMRYFIRNGFSYDDIQNLIHKMKHGLNEI